MSIAGSHGQSDLLLIGNPWLSLLRLPRLFWSSDPLPVFRNPRYLLVLTLVLVVIAGACYWWFTSNHVPETVAILEFPDVNYPESEYLNASLDVAYVGSQSCRECHTDQYQSWERSAHAEALKELTSEKLPPAGRVDHPQSGRYYEIYHKDGELHHRESITLADGSQLALLDLPVKYEIGSGRYSKSYLIERDGFLVESPVTWYHESQSWGMSPGYDEPVHPSFRRVIELNCVLCHAGEIEPSSESRFHYELKELAVSCERCHGPGEIHQQQAIAAHEDLAKGIVNPSHLNRELQEAICSDCHLGATIQVPARGRQVHEFRPGLRLEDFRQEYSLVETGESRSEMTVTGHVEQMRSSACWQKSDAFTCTTCHDPHDHRSQREQQLGYRKVCLDCHSCSEAEEVRLQTTLSDHCVICHMPQTPTDLPHFVFTHHRVGIYESPPEEPSENLPPRGTLQAVGDLKTLGDLEQQYSRGLAHLELADQNEIKQDMSYYRGRGRALILELAEQGYRDPVIASILARLASDQGQNVEAKTLCNQFLEDPNLNADRRFELLEILAYSEMQTGEFQRAAELLQKLTVLRYEAVDWMQLAVCYQNLGKLSQAIEATRKCLEIDPAPGAAHLFITQLYLQTGNQEKMQYHQKLGRLLPLHGFPEIREPQ